VSSRPYVGVKRQARCAHAERVNKRLHHFALGVDRDVQEVAAVIGIEAFMAIAMFGALLTLE
jgi:hypothetical protein